METKLLMIKAENGVFSKEEDEALQRAGAILKQGGLNIKI